MWLQYIDTSGMPLPISLKKKMRIIIHVFDAFKPGNPDCGITYPNLQQRSQCNNTNVATPAT